MKHILTMILIVFSWPVFAAQGGASHDIMMVARSFLAYQLNVDTAVIDQNYVSSAEFVIEYDDDQGVTVTFKGADQTCIVDLGSMSLNIRRYSCSK